MNIFIERPATVVLVSRSTESATVSVVSPALTCHPTRCKQHNGRLHFLT